ncbi:MAG: hypothetical protein LKE59_12125 [Eubacterium sp.]|jgi:hypothetical protein|nr:hypothetical protein [Eubacterium sp.]MCH4078901.1 hypothetical protein [Eubacterium sp.]
MYETRIDTRQVKGKEIETWKREIFDANILSVEAGTNGYCGGDTGHGSRTYIRIEDMAGTDITVRPLRNYFKDNSGLELILGGDSELSTILEALKFITKVLTDQIEEERA